jgi:hypothetical protein
MSAIKETNIKTMVLICIVILNGCITNPPADAPSTGTVAGRITSSENQSVSSTLITITGAEYSTRCDEQGIWSISGVESGEHTVVLAHGKHEVKSIKVTINAGETSFIDVELRTLSRNEVSFSEEILTDIALETESINDAQCLVDCLVETLQTHEIVYQVDTQFIYDTIYIEISKSADLPERDLSQCQESCDISGNDASPGLNQPSPSTGYWSQVLEVANANFTGMEHIGSGIILLSGYTDTGYPAYITAPVLKTWTNGTWSDLEVPADLLKITTLRALSDKVWLVGGTRTYYGSEKSAVWRVNDGVWSQIFQYDYKTDINGVGELYGQNFIIIGADLYELKGSDLFRVSNYKCNEMVQTDSELYCHERKRYMTAVYSYDGSGWFTPEWTKAISGNTRTGLHIGKDGWKAINGSYGKFIIANPEGIITMNETYDTFGIDGGTNSKSFCLLDGDSFIVSGEYGKMAHIANGVFFSKQLPFNLETDQLVMESNHLAWARSQDKVFVYQVE